MGQKWQKLQIQDLLNEVYPKGQIFKMTLFSPIDLDKIMPKIQNCENSKLKTSNIKLCQAKIKINK